MDMWQLVPRRSTRSSFSGPMSTTIGTMLQFDSAVVEARSLDLDARRGDDLAPALDLALYVACELRRRVADRDGAQRRKLILDFRCVQSFDRCGLDLGEDCRRRGNRRHQAIPVVGF